MHFFGELGAKLEPLDFEVFTLSVQQFQFSKHKPVQILSKSSVMACCGMLRPKHAFM